MSFRIYIDESGDHILHDSPNPAPRYLGLTAIVIRKSDYNPSVPLGLEALKRKHFPYDVDDPPILVRKQVIERKSHFGALRDAGLNTQWEEDLLAFLSELPGHVATVVFDKASLRGSVGKAVLEPYHRCWEALLSNVGFWLSKQENEVADIMPEGRGKKEDGELQKFYQKLRETGVNNLDAVQFTIVLPDESLLFGRKWNNIAGLQIADIIAAEQKILTVQEAKGIAEYPIGAFGQRINAAIHAKVIPGGRMLLE